MHKKAGLNLVMLILIVISIILWIIFLINKNMFYLITVLCFYLICVHYLELSKLDKIHPAINHFLVVLIFTVLYSEAIKKIFTTILGRLIPYFQTNFAENLFIAVLTVIMLNIFDIILSYTNYHIRRNKKIKIKNLK